MKIKNILKESEIKKAIKRMSVEIFKGNKDIANLVIVGIQTRGVHLAMRLLSHLKKTTKKNISFGQLDITFYRDDIDKISHQPIVKETKITDDITDKDILLVDDVLFTGRTIRAALDALMDYGRPKTIKLAVLIDRGCRELPIRPDYVGKILTTNTKEMVSVKLKEVDGKDEVVIR